ncbi:glycosyltransferase [Teredinibacter haidensis]|uniref:glycosyltransferase n=1 Tax=Teredinibacter haidensis TaxID=2731755 RepID=UPI00094893FB|nr:glycosyltransferase [Teredinibacter haidensis]
MLKVVVFRCQLFKLSESFIANQARVFRKFKAFYVGRACFSDSKVDFGDSVITLEPLSFIKNVLFVLSMRSKYLLDSVARLSPNIIHAHFGVDALYALNISKRLGVPLVVTFHGFDATATRKALFRSLKPAWINYALFRSRLKTEAELYICVSDFIRSKVLALGLLADKSVTHYIGIDIDRTYLRKQRNNADKVTILHVARLTEKKGTQYLLEAISLLDGDNFELIVVGDGPLRAELEAQIKINNLAGKVRLLGALDNHAVLQWMKKADIFCLPSVTAKSGDTEGLPITILEAFVYMMPVVATNHAGIPEAVLDGENGFLVPERDANKLAEKLKILIDSPVKRVEMGLKARETVEKKFDIEKQSKKLEAIYSLVIENYAHRNSN